MEPEYVTALIAAAVAVAVAVLSPAFTAAAERRLRRREVLAKAVGALAAYREYPYVIRRRDGTDPPGERRRITGEIMSIQRELTEASIWIGAEAPGLSESFEAAVQDHRRIAGGLMNDAWQAEPADGDSGMNISDVHTALEPLRAHDRELAHQVRREVRFRWNPYR